MTTPPLITNYASGKYVAAEGSVEVVRADYRPDKTKTACVYSHSLGLTALAALDPTTAQKPLDAIAAAGLPVIATDLGGANAWGNDTQVSRMGSAAFYAQVTMGAKGTGIGDAKVVVFAASMGGLAALTWARLNPTLCAAIALVCPVVDLAYEHDQNVNGYAASIEAAYGGAAGYAAEVAGNNPMANAAAIKATGIPIKMWRASNDVIAVTARQDAFAAAAGVEVVDLGAIGHTITQAPWADVADFLVDHA